MKLNLRRFYLKYKDFFFPVGLVIASIIFFIFIVIPAAQSTISLFVDAKNIESDVSVLNQKLSVLDQLDENTLQQQLVSATAAIPIDRSLPTALATVEAIAAQSQVTVKLVSMQNTSTLSPGVVVPPTKEESALGMSLMPFTVSLSGTFAQVQSFLQLSTQVRRFIRTQSFTLDFPTSGDQLSTQVSFDAFFAALPKTPPTETLHLLTTAEQQTVSRLDNFPNVGSQTVADNNFQQSEGAKLNPFAQ